MSKKYEALVIFSTAVRDDDLEGALGRFADELQKLGATIESTEALGRRTFARTIDKRDTALYGKVRIDAARERFRLYEDTLRIQFVARNLRIEAAKAKDDARRAAFQAKLAEKAAAAAAAAEAAGEPAPADGPEA